MTIELHSVEGITPDSRDIAGYDRVVANAIILTADNKILLQRRGAEDKSYPDALVLFGGGVEADETLTDALCRELAEELEATVDAKDLLFLGAQTFTRRGMQPLVATFFWHDRNGTIGACHEDTPETFASSALALAETNVHPALHWAIGECVRRGLIPA